MKTKIKYFLGLFIISIVFISPMKSQIFSGGIMAGISTGAVRVQNVGNSATNVIQGNNIMGFETGIFAKLMLSPFYIKPMALYNFSTGDVSDMNEGASQTSTFSMNRLEVPVLFGFKILGPLSVEAGPVYNYIIQSTNQYGDNNLTIAQGSGIGYRVGVALEIKRFLMNVSYGGVTVNSSETNHATFKEPYKVVFGLGVKLGKHEHKKDKDKDNSRKEDDK